MALATSSLPVPVSPESDTDMLVVHAFSNNSKTFFMAGLEPIMLFPNSYFSAISFFQVVDFPNQRRFVTRVADRIQQAVFRLMIFGDVVECTGFEQRYRCIDFLLCRNDDHIDIGIVVFDLLQHGFTR